LGVENVMVMDPVGTKSPFVEVPVTDASFSDTVKEGFMRVKEGRVFFLVGSASPVLTVRWDVSEPKETLWLSPPSGRAVVEAALSEDEVASKMVEVDVKAVRVMVLVCMVCVTVMVTSGAASSEGEERAEVEDAPVALPCLALTVALLVIDTLLEEDEAVPLGVADARVAPDTVEVCSSIVPWWRTTTQLPNPATCLKLTRQRSPEEPPEHLRLAGSWTTRSCGAFVLGSWSESSDQQDLYFSTSELTRSPFCMTVALTNVAPKPVGSTIALKKRDPSRPLELKWANVVGKYNEARTHWSWGQ
jgi:hypothetical protein